MYTTNRMREEYYQFTCVPGTRMYVYYNDIASASQVQATSTTAPFGAEIQRKAVERFQLQIKIHRHKKLHNYGHVCKYNSYCKYRCLYSRSPGMYVKALSSFATIATHHFFLHTLLICGRSTIRNISGFYYFQVLGCKFDPPRHL